MKFKKNRILIMFFLLMINPAIVFSLAIKSNIPSQIELLQSTHQTHLFLIEDLKLQNQKILVFGPHHDDQALGGAAGVFLKLAKDNNVLYVTMTKTESARVARAMGYKPREQLKMRAKEQQADAQLVTGKPGRILNLDFGHRFFSEAVYKTDVDQLIALFEKEEPDVVILPFGEDDIHSQHRVAYKTLMTALKFYQGKIKLLMYEAASSLVPKINEKINLIEPLSLDDMKKIMQAIKNHRSQLWTDIGDTYFATKEYQEVIKNVLGQEYVEKPSGLIAEALLKKPYVKDLLVIVYGQDLPPIFTYTHLVILKCLYYANFLKEKFGIQVTFANRGIWYEDPTNILLKFDTGIPWADQYVDEKILDKRRMVFENTDKRDKFITQLKDLKEYVKQLGQLSILDEFSKKLSEKIIEWITPLLTNQSCLKDQTFLRQFFKVHVLTTALGHGKNWGSPSLWTTQEHYKGSLQHKLGEGTYSAPYENFDFLSELWKESENMDWGRKTIFFNTLEEASSILLGVIFRELNFKERKQFFLSRILNEIRLAVRLVDLNHAPTIATLTPQPQDPVSMHIINQFPSSSIGNPLSAVACEDPSISKQIHPLSESPSTEITGQINSSEDEISMVQGITPPCSVPPNNQTFFISQIIDYEKAYQLEVRQLESSEVRDKDTLIFLNLSETEDQKILEEMSKRKDSRSFIIIGFLDEKLSSSLKETISNLVLDQDVSVFLLSRFKKTWPGEKFFLSYGILDVYSKDTKIKTWLQEIKSERAKKVGYMSWFFHDLIMLLFQNSFEESSLDYEIQESFYPVSVRKDVLVADDYALERLKVLKNSYDFIDKKIDETVRKVNGFSDIFIFFNTYANEEIKKIECLISDIKANRNRINFEFLCQLEANRRSFLFCLAICRLCIKDSMGTEASYRASQNEINEFYRNSKYKCQTLIFDKYSGIADVLSFLNKDECELIDVSNYQKSWEEIKDDITQKINQIKSGNKRTVFVIKTSRLNFDVVPEIISKIDLPVNCFILLSYEINNVWQDGMDLLGAGVITFFGEERGVEDMKVVLSGLRDRHGYGLKKMKIEKLRCLELFPDEIKARWYRHQQNMIEINSALEKKMPIELKFFTLKENGLPILKLYLNFDGKNEKDAIKRKNFLEILFEEGVKQEMELIRGGGWGYNHTRVDYVYDEDHVYLSIAPGIQDIRPFITALINSFDRMAQMEQSA